MTKTMTILTMSILLSGVIVVGFSASSVSATSNIVVNGSFEDGPATCPNGNEVTLGIGNPDLTGWDITGGNIDWLCDPNPHWLASDGAHSLDLDGLFAVGTISQDLSTTSGTTYKVDFDLAGNSGGGPAVKTMSVSAAGFSETFDTDTSAQDANGDWDSGTFYFTATDSTTTLEFKSLSDAGNAWGPTLDNVSAEAPKKVDVCHKEKKTINISNHAVPAHLAHGDTLGAC